MRVTASGGACLSKSTTPKKVTFVRKLGVEENTGYGAPALKVGGKLLACFPTHKSAEPDSLVVRIDFADRDELIAAAPDTYYVKDHYKDYSAVLVRLSRIDADRLCDLLRGAWRFVSNKENCAGRAGAQVRRR